MRAILFDLDGVLVYTDQFHYQAWKRLADRLGICFDETINNRLRGVSRMESLDIVLERAERQYSDEEKERFAAEKNEQYRKLLATMTPADVSPTVRETLTELKRRGYRLAIGSSSKNTKFILRQVGLTDFFDAVSDGTNISRSKPDPEVFLKAAEFLGEAPEACAVIEDAVSGIDAAKAAGMWAVGLGDAAKYERADACIQAFSELLDLFPERRKQMDLRDKPFYLTEKEMTWVQDTLSQLSDREKVGQLFCVMGNSFPGEELDRLITEFGVGAVLFRPLPPETLIENFRRLDALTKLPLLKAANLESGGDGAMAGGTLYSQPLGTAAAGSPDYARELAEVCANEGRSVGINWSFSPVTDINLNFQNPITHIRSFGSDPDTVREYSLAYVRALQDGGIAACAKHFPGDGVDFRDHHLHPTCNSLSAEDWNASFGRNYKALIDAGLLSVMVGHIMQPAVEREANPALGEGDCLPASLSPTLLKTVLRGKLGFNGLISSDATIMRGFNQVMERRRAIPAAIEVGCDMLVFNVDFYEDYAYMLEGLETGLLSRERLNEAVMRVLALKAVTQRHTGLTQRDPQNREKSRACLDRAITLVKDRENALPMTPARYPEITLILHGKDKGFGDVVGLSDMVEEKLLKEGFRVRRFERNVTAPGKTEGLAKSQLLLHVANFGADSNNTANRIFWVQPHGQDAPRFLNEQTEIFLSFGYPFHLQDVPRIKTFVNSYTCSRDAVDLTIDKLMGRSDFTGVSPVDPFCGLPDTRY